MKMRRVLLALGGAVVLLLLAVAAIYYWLSQDDYLRLRAGLADELRDRLGLELSIDGDTAISLSLVPTVTLSDVTLKNPNWDGEQTLFSAKQLEATFKLLPLIRRGEFESENLVVVDGRVNIDRKPDGSSNWAFNDSNDSQKTSDSTTELPGVVSVNWSNVAVYVTGPEKEDKHVFLIHTLKVTGPENEQEASAVTGSGRVDELELSIDGTIDSWRDFRTGKEAKLNLTATMGTNTAKFSGTLGEAGERLGEGIGFDVSGASLSFLDPWLPVTLPSTERYAAKGTFTAKAAKYVVDVGSLSITQGPLAVTAQGSITFDADSIALDTTLTATGQDLQKAGEWLAGLDILPDKLPTTGQFDAQVTLNGAPEGLALDDIDATVQTSAGSNVFKGSIANVNELTGFDLDVTLTGGDLSDFLTPLKSMTEIDFSLPKTDSYSASANIAGSLETLKATAINAEAKDGPLSAAVTGSIANIIEVDGLDIAVDAKGRNLETLAARFGVEAIPTRRFEASGTLTGSIDDLSLPTLTGKVGAADAALIFSGSIGRLQPLQGISVKVDVSGDDLSTLSKIADTSLPATTMFRAKGLLRGNETALALSELSGETQLEGETITIAGAVGDLIQFSGLALNVKGGGQDLARVAKLADLDLPAGISHEFSLTLTGSLDALQLSGATATAGIKDATVTLTGDIDDLLPVKGISVAFDATGPADQIAALAGYDWDDDDAVDASGKMTGSLTEFSLNPFSVSVGDSKTSGTLKIGHGEELSIVGTLGETVIDLERQDPPPDEEKTDEDVSLDWLDVLDLDIAYDELTIMLKNAQFKLAPGHLLMQDGELDLDPLAVHYRDDLISGKIKINGRSDAMSMTMQGTGIDFGQMLADFELTEDITASGDFYIDLSANAASKDKLIASLTGQSRLLIGEGQIASIGSTNLNIMGQLAPWRKKSAPLQFSCFLASMTINNGIIDPDSFYINATDMVITGGGVINLVEDSIDVAIAPRAKNKRYLDASVSLFVKGALDEPKVSVGKLSAISDVGVKYGSWAVLGPFALALPFIHKGKKPPDCQTVTQGILEKQGATPAASEN